VRETNPTQHPNLAGLPIDHLGIAVRDLDEASAPYSLLGLLRVGEDELVPSQGVRIRALQAGESLIELLEPTTAESPIAAFLAKRGPGLHHVAFRVDDLQGAVERLVARGARFIDREPRAGRAGTQVAFLHPQWGVGVLIELVEHH
jgi:methylmalonyl-CoA/ethylmalonyl-CoA epimerase